MTADRDYYSGAFLDWFPGNIQHLNSIASVLQCPPAAQQYNETAGRAEQSRAEQSRAGTQKRDTLLHSPLFSVGKQWLPLLLLHADMLVMLLKVNTHLNKLSKDTFTTKCWFSNATSAANREGFRQHINIHVQYSLKLYPGRCCPLSHFMMKVNNWFHYMAMEL